MALFTFVVFQWLVASGRIERFVDQDGLQQQLKTQASDSKRVRRERKQDPEYSPFHERAAGDFFHNKILSFGGGFYGTMALMTYALIEAVEVWQFLLSVFDPDSWIDRLVPGMIVEFLINSLMNLVSAFIWFATLPDYIHMDSGLIWLAAAYGGYLGGLQLVSRWGDDLWSWLAARLRALRKR